MAWYQVELSTDGLRRCIWKRPTLRQFAFPALRNPNNAIFVLLIRINQAKSG